MNKRGIAIIIFLSVVFLAILLADKPEHPEKKSFVNEYVHIPDGMKVEVDSHWDNDGAEYARIKVVPKRVYNFAIMETVVKHIWKLVLSAIAVIAFFLRHDKIWCIIAKIFSKKKLSNDDNK